MYFLSVHVFLTERLLPFAFLCFYRDAQRQLSFHRIYILQFILRTIPLLGNANWRVQRAISYYFTLTRSCGSSSKHRYQSSLVNVGAIIYRDGERARWDFFFPGAAHGRSCTKVTTTTTTGCSRRKEERKKERKRRTGRCSVVARHRKYRRHMLRRLSVV